MRKSTILIYNVAVILFFLFCALLLGAGLFAVAGGNPLAAYAVMFTEPLKDPFGISETLVRATPLMLVAVGVAISFRSGILNIGGEGQILIGAVAGAFVGLALPDLPKFLLIPLIFATAFVGGALWGTIAGWLKAYLGVNEILSTVMLNYIASQVYIYLLRAPMIDPQELAYGTGIPQTAQLSPNAWLTRLMPPMRLHSGLIYAVLLAVDPEGSVHAAGGEDEGGADLQGDPHVRHVRDGGYLRRHRSGRRRGHGDQVGRARLEGRDEEARDQGLAQRVPRRNGFGGAVPADTAVAAPR